MSCDFYYFSDGIFGDYSCRIKKGSVNSDTYYKYCRDYNYRECPIYKNYTNSSSGCFITTIVCDTLKKSDDDSVLMTLRSFRDNVMQKDKKYEQYLKAYDTIGQEIACSIYHDKDKEKLAQNLYSSVLIPVCDDIKEKNYSKAITKYEIMTLSLIEYYNLKKQFNNYLANDFGYNGDFDSKTAGHGKVRKLIKNQI